MNLCLRAFLVASVACMLPIADAANTPPLSKTWNIAPSGTSSSSGELLFRVTPADGGDATEITVFVLSGANDMSVASNIRRALNLQLRADRFNVEPGEGANVLLTSPSQDFSLELVDSDVENVRVSVQSATPVAPPTVPKQARPANDPAPETPSVPGEAAPSPTTAPPGNASQPAAPPPANAPSLPNPAPPPNATGESAPASVPPPTGARPN